MRITFILPIVNMSGGIKVPAIYARALAAQNHTVTLVSPPPATTPVRRKIKSWLAGKGWPRNPQSLQSHLDGTGLDHRVLDRFRPVTDSDVPDADIVIATWWETAEWVHALSPRKGKKIYFIQGHEIFPNLPVERCHATYRLPLHKIVVSQWLKNIMQNQYGDHDTDLVPNGVDHAQFFAPARGRQSTPTLGFLYSTSFAKGLNIALKAIDAVRSKIPELRLLAFGSMPPTENLPLPPRTEFSLLPPQDAIRNIYAECDVWLSASRSEGFNLTAMEAMACRTPVVSTRTGWPEAAIVSGHNGFLTDIDDADALADAILRILGLNEADWRVMSQHAFETVADCSWAASAQQFERALWKARHQHLQS